MKKPYVLPFFIIALAFMVLTGCGSKPVAVSNDVVDKPVRVMAVKTETTDVTLDYIGTIGIDQTRRLAFKSGGRLSRIPIEKGQEVHKDMILAELEKEELQMALDAANAQLASAKAQYSKAVNGASKEDINKALLNVDKAQKAYDFTKDNLAKLQQLYESGAVSKSELDQAQLETNIREADLKQAQEVLKQVEAGARPEDIKALAAQVDQAEANCEIRTALLEDADLMAGEEGYVMEVLFEEGEMVGAGYPVVIIGSHAQLVKVGVTDEDLPSIAIDSPVRILAGQQEAEGIVTYISKVPDSHTRTYEAEVQLRNTDFTLGSHVDVQFVLGRETGIWIPMTAILSEGGDYVFVARDNMAVKTKVAILRTRGTQVMVEGLSDKDLLVVEGLRRLNDGDSLVIQK